MSLQVLDIGNQYKLALQFLNLFIDLRYMRHHKYKINTKYVNNENWYVPIYELIMYFGTNKIVIR